MGYRIEHPSTLVVYRNSNPSLELARTTSLEQARKLSEAAEAKAWQDNIPSFLRNKGGLAATALLASWPFALGLLLAIGYHH